MRLALPLSAWRDLGLPLLRLWVFAEFAGAEAIVVDVDRTGWVRAVYHRTTLEADDSAFQVPLTSRDMILAAADLFDGGLPAWLHPDTSRLTREQIAEAVVSLYTITRTGERTWTKPGLLSLDAEGRVQHLGDGDRRWRFSVSLEPAPPIPPIGQKLRELSATEVEEGEWIARVVRRNGSFGPETSYAQYLGSKRTVLRSLEFELGQEGYLFLDPDGHIRPARDVVDRAELPF